MRGEDVAEEEYFRIMGALMPVGTPVVHPSDQDLGYLNRTAKEEIAERKKQIDVHQARGANA